MLLKRDESVSPVDLPGTWGSVKAVESGVIGTRGWDN